MRERPSLMRDHIDKRPSLPGTTTNKDHADESPSVEKDNNDLFYFLAFFKNFLFTFACKLKPQTKVEEEKQKKKEEECKSK